MMFWLLAVRNETSQDLIPCSSELLAELFPYFYEEIWP